MRKLSIFSLSRNRPKNDVAALVQLPSAGHNVIFRDNIWIRVETITKLNSLRISPENKHNTAIIHKLNGHFMSLSGNGFSQLEIMLIE